MSALNISVTGIRPNNQSIAPPGNHLRWAFPSQAGFPAMGFVVHRRISGEIKATECLNLTKEKILPEQIVFSGTNLQGVVFVYPGPSRIEGTGAGLSINPPGSGMLDLRFTQPMIHVSLFVRGIKAGIQLKAYVGRHIVAISPTLTSSHGSGTLSVTAPYINRVIIPLQFTSLLEVCYRRLADECRNENWGDSPIMNLPLPKTFDEAIGRLPADPFFNRYASNAGDAIQRYKPGLKQLLEWLWLLQNPTSAQFSNPGDLPDQLRLPSTDVQHPLQTIQPQSILLLAALDPNIARLLSLYWTDMEGAPDGPEPGNAYDYKVEGRWSSHRVGCGLVFGLGNEKASRPYVSGRLRGDQLPGLRFYGKEPLGRVGLRWPRPREGQGTVQPVLFDLSRQSDNRDAELTGAMPVLVPASAWDQEDTALFIDTDVALGEHTYSLRPIDLFGQVGKWIKSGRVIVQDLEAPPPPVRLRVTTAQPGYPWLTDEQKSTSEKENVDVDLRFEYGDAQNRQAPDAGSFQLYYRTESLFERQTVTAQIQMTTELSNGLKVYTVQIIGVPGIDLSRYAGGILARQSANETALPADQRLRFRIAEVLASNRLKLGPTEENFPAGSYQIISDPHLRATWQPWGQPMPVRPELESPLKKVGDVFQARAARVQTLGAEPHPLSLLPASHQPDSLTQPPANVEVLLDCELLEPDLFTGGEVQINGQNIPVVYSTSGPAFTGHNQAIAARLSLPPDSPVSENTSLQLIPAETSLVRVLTLETANLSMFQQTPGGEAAFDVLAGQSGETLAYVARVMSSIQLEGASAFSVLVRLLSPAALTALESGVRQVRYYPPYRVKLRAALESEAAPPEGILPLPLPDGQSSQNLYLAITTSDPRMNESPLSAPVQVTAVKPPPKGAPGRPYPCPDAGADAGYATPPDRQGRATLCLEWGAGSLELTNGLRYEVARALDNTILTAHRRNWLLGQVEIEVPVTGGIQVEATLTHINLDTKRGLYTANMAAADLGNLAPAKFQGGRLTQNGRHFQVTAIGTGNNEDLQVVLRPMAQEGPAEGAAMLYSPPDYSGVRNDTEALRELATQNPDAFGIVTGVPIRETDYLDEIPGIGRNRYFYRVRAVDRAENRSAWSEVSVPFYQVDTTPPEAPSVVNVLGLEKKVVIAFAPPADPAIIGFALFASENELRPADAVEEGFLDANYGQMVTPRRLRVLNGLLNLSGVAYETIAQLTEVVAVNPLQEDGAPDTLQNLIAGGGQFDNQKRVISWVNNTPQHGVPVALRYVDGQGNQRIIDHLSGHYEFTYRLNKLGPRRQICHFWLQSLKRLSRGNGSVINVYSTAAGPVSTVLFDREHPPAPEWIELVWEDDGQSMTAVLSFQVDWPVAIYTIERKLSFSDKWHVVGEVVDPAVGVLRFEDKEANPAFTYYYRLKARIFEKENDVFDIGELHRATQE